MRYLYVGGQPRQKMHIMRFTPIGGITMRALCGMDLPFDRTINPPFSLGKGVCRNCERRASHIIEKAGHRT